MTYRRPLLSSHSVVSPCPPTVFSTGPGQVHALSWAQKMFPFLASTPDQSEQGPKVSSGTMLSTASVFSDVEWVGGYLRSCLQSFAGGGSPKPGPQGSVPH